MAKKSSRNKKKSKEPEASRLFTVTCRVSLKEAAVLLGSRRKLDNARKQYLLNNPKNFGVIVNMNEKVALFYENKCYYVVSQDPGAIMEFLKPGDSQQEQNKSQPMSAPEPIPSRLHGFRVGR